MTTTITGQTRPFGVVTGMPGNWPVTNSAGASLTEPGNTVAVADGAGAWSMQVPETSPWKLRYHDGSEHSGTTPATPTTAAQLVTSHGWPPAKQPVAA